MSLDKEPTEKMPVLESNLTIFLALLLFLMVAGFAVRTLWRPHLRRVWMYFIAWWERDARAEREAKLLKLARQQAESEMNGTLGEDLETPADTKNIQAQTILVDAKPVREVLTEETKQTLRN